jgi:hypothetical protein
VAIDKNDILTLRMPGADVSARARKLGGVVKPPYGHGAVFFEVFHYLNGPVSRSSNGHKDLKAVQRIFLLSKLL